jgi:hypothetical protein
VAKRRSNTQRAIQQTSAPVHRSQSPIEAAMERGDVRTARRLATAADPQKTSPTDSERIATKHVLERTRPDPIALLAAAAVFVAIVLAAWLALFRAH